MRQKKIDPMMIQQVETVKVTNKEMGVGTKNKVETMKIKAKTKMKKKIPPIPATEFLVWQQLLLQQVLL